MKIKTSLELEFDGLTKEMKNLLDRRVCNNFLLDKTKNVYMNLSLCVIEMIFPHPLRNVIVMIQRTIFF
jgi:hypothetical protein